RKIETVNALLAEVGSIYRYEAHKTEGYTSADLLHITESGAEIEAANASGWGRGQEYSLNTTAEIYHNMRIVEGLIKRLQEEGLLRKKPKISI
ncbi:MAG: hypothetical protein ACRD8Z_24105, partial [Nitrososphaeraceae archaeon]